MGNKGFSHRRLLYLLFNVTKKIKLNKELLLTSIKNKEYIYTKLNKLYSIVSIYKNIHYIQKYFWGF